MRCQPLGSMVAVVTSVVAPMTLLFSASASAEPPVPAPTPGDPLAVPAPAPSTPFAPFPVAAPMPAGDPPAGQNPLPYTGPPVFAPPTFNPVNGSTVGVAKPIIINFQRPIADRPMAEQAVHISSNPRFPGSFTG